MRVLFDQGTPVRVASFLPAHTVCTARSQGWSCISNGELLDRAEQAGFDVLITTDNNLRYQQRLKGREIAIIVLSRNRWRLVARMALEIARAVDEARPGTYRVIAV